MLHDGVEHILLVAPTRSGKGVNTIIPTGLVWSHSIFFFDVKEELWQATAGYRQKVFGQKVMKFAPLVGDGSSARWNPLAEINFRTAEEISDVAMIVGIMVKPDGEKAGGSGDSAFWDNSAAALITGVIMHLMYKHHKENLRLPCPTDIMSFLSSPDMDLKELFTYMKNYPHISPEEFLELPDASGTPRVNPLKEIYGEYVQNLRPFAKVFEGKKIKNLEDVRRETLELMQEEDIDWEGDDDDDENPFHILLTHPKVAECAANMLNGVEQTRASIMQTVQTALALYQNPVVQKFLKENLFMRRKRYEKFLGRDFMKVIETEYKGYRFRSRLEARWAVFFDACGVKWEYEPEGFDLGDGIYYLPDFLLHDVFDDSGVDYTGSTDLWVEVKGVMTEIDAKKILYFSGMSPILVVGNIPDGNDIYDLVSCAIEQSDSTDLFYPYATIFNFDTICGNNWGALPGINKQGIFDILPIGATRNFDDINAKATEKAYRLARQARFEHR